MGALGTTTRVIMDLPLVAAQDSKKGSNTGETDPKPTILLSKTEIEPQVATMEVETIETSTMDNRLEAQDL